MSQAGVLTNLFSSRAVPVDAWRLQECEEHESASGPGPLKNNVSAEASSGRGYAWQRASPTQEDVIQTFHSLQRTGADCAGDQEAVLALATTW